MSKTYTCRDVGVDCDWNTSGDTKCSGAPDDRVNPRVGGKGTRRD
jgi:hypothetical protein